MNSVLRPLGNSRHHKESAQELQSLGLRPGKKITKQSALLNSGPVVLKVDGFQLAIGHGKAMRVFVEVAPGEPGLSGRLRLPAAIIWFRINYIVFSRNREFSIFNLPQLQDFICLPGGVSQAWFLKTGTGEPGLNYLCKGYSFTPN